MQSSDATLAVALRELSAAVARHLPRGTVSRAAASTLSVLRREGAQRITVLAEREAVSQPAMTNLVQRLEAQGLVTRAADPVDARATLISVTEAGVRVIDERRRLQDDALRSTLERLSPEDRAALAAALPALTHFTELHESR